MQFWKAKCNHRNGTPNEKLKCYQYLFFEQFGQSHLYNLRLLYFFLLWEFIKISVFNGNYWAQQHRALQFTSFFANLIATPFLDLFFCSWNSSFPQLLLHFYCVVIYFSNNSGFNTISWGDMNSALSFLKTSSPCRNANVSCGDLLFNFFLLYEFMWFSINWMSFSCVRSSKLVPFGSIRRINSWLFSIAPFSNGDDGLQ